jgi:hypothetical protein
MTGRDFPKSGLPQWRHANTNAGIAAQRRQFGHPGPLLTATKDIDISEAAVVAKLVLS